MYEPEVRLRQATVEDIPALLNLLNQSYRENLGWTNEAHLVSGIRTTAAEIEAVIDNPKHYLFVYPEVSIDMHKDSKEETGKILACISVEFKSNDVSHEYAKENISEPSAYHSANSAYSAYSAYIGTFAVDPMLQGKGIGNVVLSAAETFAVRHLRVAKNSTDQGDANAESQDDKSMLGMVHLKMSILEQRPELLAYYQRRGYQLTGKSQPFPKDGNNGEPKLDDLKLLELEKWV